MSELPPASTDSTLRLLVQGQRVFDRFVLESVLGQGGMGVVWKARDEALEKDVALKFILESRARDPEAVAGLKHETRRCQELRHAGIVAIYDLLQDSDRVAVSMEYVAGATLAARKVERETGCFDPADVLPWLDQLKDALTYAHRDARVVHRDLKPSNLILTPSGRLKVMDFGISQQLLETVAGTAGTRVEGISLPYGSPQQLLGERARVADDVYSLGATIYDLLTGKPPFFRGRLELQVLELKPSSMDERRTELNHSGAPIPRHWEEVIGAALSKEPGDRPASVAELVDALRDERADRPKDVPVAPVVPVVRVVVPKVAVPKVEAPAPAAVERRAVFQAGAKDETVKAVGWVPTLAPKVRRIRDASWQVTAIVVLGFALLVAFGIHWKRHSVETPAPAAVAPVATAAPEKPRPDPLRPAALQPTGVKPPPKSR